MAFFLKLGNETYPRPTSINVSGNELENIIECFSEIGDILVSSEKDNDSIDFFIEFLTNNSPLPLLEVDSSGLVPSNMYDQYCICVEFIL